jgi:UDP-N-acetylglucosamine--N-acetylmuramyl-(pentapeptide) pyrophosphoryl-undecaprenol N-acetylglucosamine transferase
MGGSQGSQRINQVFLSTIREIPEKKNFQIIHLSGAKEFNDLLAAYKKIDISFRLFDFLKEMHYAYSLADLAITRAGATTLQEIIFFRLPAVIIPYPFAYEHQIANARLLVNKKAALLMEDSQLDARGLRETVIDLYKNRSKINNMRRHYDDIQPSVYSQDLSDLALSLVR